MTCILRLGGRNVERSYLPSVAMIDRGPVILSDSPRYAVGYIASYSPPDANNARGFLSLSQDMKRALRFDNSRAAAEFIRSLWANDGIPPSNHSLALIDIEFVDVDQNQLS